MSQHPPQTPTSPDTTPQPETPHPTPRPQPPQGPQTPTVPGGRYHTVADTVAAQDRAYFEQHPQATRYVRKAVAGELGPPATLYKGAYVIVTQLAPGVRHRRLMQAARWS